MASFINFGGFDPSPQNYLARQQFRDKQARQLGQDIGSIAGGFLKMRQDEINRQEQEKYTADKKKAQEAYARKGEFVFDKDKFKPIDPYSLDVSEYGKTVGPEEEVQLTPETEFKLLDDGSTYVLPSKDFDVTGKRFAAGTEIPLTPDREFRVLEDGSTYFPGKQYTEEDIKAEELKALRDYYGDPDMTFEEHERLQQTWRPGMTRSEELYHEANLTRPHNPKRADWLEEQSFKAYEQEQDQKLRADLQAQQLGVKQTIAAAKSKEDAQKNAVIRAENALGKTNSSINQLTSQYAALVSQGRIDESKEIQENIDDLNAVKNAQWNRLNRLSPEDYPSLKNVDDPTDAELKKASGNSNVDNKLVEIAKESVLDDGTQSLLEIMKLPPVEKEQAMKMSNELLKSKRDNLKFLAEQKQQKLQLKSAEMKFAEDAEGTPEQRKAYGFYKLINNNKNMKPISKEALLGLTGTGYDTIDNLFKVKNINKTPDLIKAITVVRGILRKKSGAAIGIDEMKSKIDEIIPVQGDSEETIRIKQENLENELADLLGQSAAKYRKKSGNDKPKKRKASW